MSNARPIVLYSVCLVLGACGKEPLLNPGTGDSGPSGAGGTSVPPTGGVPTVASTGGTMSSGGAPATGGIASTGGASFTGGIPATGGGFFTGGISFTGGTTGRPTGGTTSTGGTTAFPRGGSAGTARGGSATGGTTQTASGGAGGARSGGSSGTSSCAGVSCTPLPTTCKKLVQEPGACCPTCTDTGCGPCKDLTCAAGTHKETVAGDCCPSCVPDPPDPCLKGQKDYQVMRAQMLDKYSSGGCKNSMDCTLILESNACGAVCNVPIPSSMADTLQTNLRSVAATDCSTCAPPRQLLCEQMLAACLNGKCVAASPQ